MTSTFGPWRTRAVRCTCLLLAPRVISLPRKVWSLLEGGLKWSSQHFILNGRDGVDGDGPKNCSRFQCSGESGVVGPLAARGIAEGDWPSVWQAVIVDLF